jgi:hypothetical protein
MAEYDISGIYCNNLYLSIHIWIVEILETYAEWTQFCQYIHYNMGSILESNNPEYYAPKNNKEFW